MDAVRGFFATFGIGGLIGAAVGWAIFELGATPDPACILPGNDVCLQMWNLGFLPFVLTTAAAGGVVGFVVQLVRN